MAKVVSVVPQSRFEHYGISFPEGWEVKFFPAPYTAAELAAACKGADYLFVGSAESPVTAEAIDGMDTIKMIHTEGVGFNEVDLDAAKAKGIPVCNNRAVNNVSVAEHCIGLMIAAQRRTALSDYQIKHDGYNPTRKAFMAQGEHEMFGQHIGLVGFGAIGKEVARRLANWNCKISYYDAFRPSAEVEKEFNVDYMEVDDLIRECDIISIHVPVLPSTIGMINAERLKSMKPTAILVNTARGEIVDQAALAQALEDGEIYAAALDVLSPEPPADDHPLFNLSEKAAARLTLSPHIGGTTDEAFTRMLTWTIENMKRMENGEKPINIVNGL